MDDCKIDGCQRDDCQKEEELHRELPLSVLFYSALTFVADIIPELEKYRAKNVNKYYREQETPDCEYVKTERYKNRVRQVDIILPALKKMRNTLDFFDQTGTCPPKLEMQTATELLRDMEVASEPTEAKLEIPGEVKGTRKDGNDDEENVVLPQLRQ